MEKNLNTSYYSQNRDKMLEKQKQKYTKLSNLFDDWKKTLTCSKCGENDVSCLDFHHVDSTKKEYKMKSALAAGPKTLIREMEKCIVVCANCHRKIHAYNTEVNVDKKLVKSLEELIL